MTATGAELAAIETALCTTGLTPYDLTPTKGGHVRRLNKALSEDVHATLRALVERNLSAQSQVRARSAGYIVGELPEPFSRPSRARGAGRRDNDMGWLGLPTPPPKARIDLPLPVERELIDLPSPRKRRPRSEL